MPVVADAAPTHIQLEAHQAVRLADCPPAWKKVCYVYVLLGLAVGTSTNHYTELPAPSRPGCLAHLPGLRNASPVYTAFAPSSSSMRSS
jgi:hypothetical protein